ncbi:MAG: hypothetical protein AAFU85_19865 [Planctomycetota bacterium]
MWRALESTPSYLRVSAGVGEDGSLLLVDYEVTHFLPSSPASGDGGIDLRPILKTRSLEGARLSTVDGKPLTIAEFQKRFNKAPNAERVGRGKPVREHHELILLVEHRGKTPLYFQDLYRPDIVVVTVPPKVILPKKVKQTGGVPVP